MEKLIEMTDFVLEQKEQYPSAGRSIDKMAEILDCIENYAEFLKQPLTLGFFVPCDENGEVMDLKGIKQSVIEGTDSWDAYEEAKERVLFHIEIPIDVEVIKYHVKMNRDVEYLANKDFPKIKLTETAKKKIGL